MWAVQITYWLLYAASTETEVLVKPWEKYLPEVKNAQQTDKPKSVAMTKKGAKTLFLTLDSPPFKPQESKNGIGRKKNDVLTKRKDAPPKRKNNTKSKKGQNFQNSS